MCCRSIRLVWPIVEALRQVDGWPGEHVAVCVTGTVEATRGDESRRFEWASVTKLASAVAMLVAAEEGLIDLDEPAGPPGATFRHLLSHSSGLPFEAGAPISAPGKRRIYSNYGFEVAAALVEERAEMSFETYFAHVWQGTTLSCGARPARERPGRSPTCVRSRTSCSRRRALRARRSQRRRRCSSRGSSVSCRGSGGRSRTTGGSASSCGTASRRTGRAPAMRRATFGHFGRSGTFLWVDPVAGIALGALTDRAFGDWAIDAWPRLADAVLAEAAVSRGQTQGHG